MQYFPDYSKDNKTIVKEEFKAPLGLGGVSIQADTALSKKLNLADNLINLDFNDIGSVLGTFSAASALIPGIGPILGPAISVIGGLFGGGGPSPEEMLSKQMNQSFEAMSKQVQQTAEILNQSIITSKTEIINEMQEINALPSAIQGKVADKMKAEKAIYDEQIEKDNLDTLNKIEANTEAAKKEYETTIQDGLHDIDSEYNAEKEKIYTMVQPRLSKAADLALKDVTKDLERAKYLMEIEKAINDIRRDVDLKPTGAQIGEYIKNAFAQRNITLPYFPPIDNPPPFDPVTPEDNSILEKDIAKKLTELLNLVRKKLVEMPAAYYSIINAQYT